MYLPATKVKPGMTVCSAEDVEHKQMVVTDTRPTSPTHPMTVVFMVGGAWQEFPGEMVFEVLSQGDEA